MLPEGEQDVCDDEDDTLLDELSVIEIDDDDAQEHNDLVIDVVVPTGCCAGDLLTVDTPDGRLVEVVVPEGHSEGESFEVTTPR
eukprot:COSAG02_NODE_7612_length_2934_cov_1.680071_2_plen_84_part_00